MKSNKIKPYTFCKLKDGNYFLIVEKINSFIFKNNIKMNNWIYFDEIESFIKRKDIEFSVSKDFEIKYI